jgi:sugar lactone lactonase YvrE
MRARVRILRQGFLVGVLAFGFAPKLAGQDTVVYATDFTNRRIWSVDITTGVNTLVTTTPVGPDSLIFAPNGNILYSARTPTGSLGSYDITAHTNTILVSGLGIPGDLALEPSMTSVLISDITGPRILRYVLGAGSYTVLASNLTIPGLIRVDGLTYDNSGKLFAALNGNSVAQIDPSNGTIIKQLARIIREYAASGGWRREVAVKMLVAL